ncbi:24890_t:CDS:2, partial [Gigaspora margarita]
KLPSDSDTDSLENELGFASKMDSTNEISFADEMNLNNNNLEQQELEKEQITSTIQTKVQYRNFRVRNTTKSAKPSVMQHKLPERKKGGLQLKSWVWSYFDRKTSPLNKAAHRECQVIKKCGLVIYIKGST